MCDIVFFFNNVEHLVFGGINRNTKKEQTIQAQTLGSRSLKSEKLHLGPQRLQVDSYRGDGPLLRFSGASTSRGPKLLGSKCLRQSCFQVFFFLQIVGVSIDCGCGCPGLVSFVDAVSFEFAWRDLRHPTAVEKTSQSPTNLRETIVVCAD